MKVPNIIKIDGMECISGAMNPQTRYDSMITKNHIVAINGRYL